MPTRRCMTKRVARENASDLVNGAEAWLKNTRMYLCNAPAAVAMFEAIGARPGEPMTEDFVRRIFEERDTRIPQCIAWSHIQLLIFGAAGPWDHHSTQCVAPPWLQGRHRSMEANCEAHTCWLGYTQTCFFRRMVSVTFR